MFTSIRSAFDVIFRKSATLQDVTPDLETNSLGIGTPTGTDLTPTSPGISKKVQLVNSNEIRPRHRRH